MLSPSEEGPLPNSQSSSTLDRREADISHPKSSTSLEKSADVEIRQVSDEQWLTSEHNPRNWTFAKKWTATAIVSFYTLVPPLASSMMAPGLLQVANRYHITNTTTTAMTLCIFQLSFALGPLVLAPLSEIHGRAWVLHISNLAFLAFNIGCALSPTAGALIGFRFLCFAGSAPIACGGGCISDLFDEKDRAGAMAVYTLGPLLGPVIGPIAGGWLAQLLGPKYVFIAIVGLSGVAALVGIPFLRETYAPIVRIRCCQPDAEKQLSFTTEHVGTEAPSKWRFLWWNISRPALLLTTNLICFVLSLYMAVVYGIYYLMFATFANFFKTTYGFGAGIGGVCYVGLGIGFFLATLFGARYADHMYASLKAKNGNVGKPEMRIPALVLGSFFVPTGVLWYGWSAQAKLHWIMPIIGSGIFGFGLMTTFLPIQLYLVDSFRYAASALAAASVFRSLLGFAFPLFGQQMYDALGLGPGNTLLAGLGIVLGIPFPIWLYYHGERMRLRSASDF